MDLAIQLEADLLSKFFLNNELMNRTTLIDYHFEHESNRNIFKACKHLHQKGLEISPMSFLSVLGKEKLEKNIGWTYLSELSMSAVTEHDFVDREKDIIENWKIRQLTELLKEETLKISKDNNLSSVPSFLEQINEVYIEAKHEDFDLRETVIDALERYANKSLMKGLKTGFTTLDYVLNGLKKKEFIVIGARPGMGKSAFAINIVDSILEINKNAWCSVFSLEMSEQEVMDRIFANHANLPLQRLTSNDDLSEIEHKQVNKVAASLMDRFKHRLYINDKSSTSMVDVWAEVGSFKAKQPKDSHGIVLIDYLTLLQMGGKSYANRHEEVSELSRTLKRLAKELDVTVIAVSQLNRATEKQQDKHPSIADLRESGQVEQDANTILLLYRDDYYKVDSDKKDIVEVIVAKNRRGPTGIVELAFNREYMRFVNLKRGNQ